MRTLIITLLLISGSAHAGFFGGDEPPKDFTSLKVTMIDSYREQVTFSIQEFVGLLKLDDANKISWDKSSDTIWALKVTRKDKTTGVTAILGWTFAKSGTKATITRTSADDIVATSEYEVMNSFQSYATIIGQVQAKNQ